MNAGAAWLRWRSAAGGGASRRRFLLDALAVLVIGVYCLARYGDCVHTFFFHDDFWILRDAALLDEQPLSGLWQIFRPSHAGVMLYRPLTQVGYFYLLRQIFGVDSSGYHATQLFFFALNSVLVYAVAKRAAASRLAGLAAALLYAAAPGHVVAVFWIAAFTMTGSATVILAMLWWWQRSDGTRRVIGCALLQVVALLSSEHGVIAPALLAVVARFSPRPAPGRRIARDLLPSIILVAAYVVVKTVSLMRPPDRGYEMGLDAAAMLQHLGRYAAASFSFLELLELAPSQLTVVGAVVVVLAFWSWRQALVGRDSWRLVALGGGIFVLALAPVLPLVSHHFDYFIGIAASGAAIAVVGACRLAGRYWRSLALAVAVAVLATDVLTLERAARSDPNLRLVLLSARASAQWIAAIENADAPVVFLPRNPMTFVMFRMGNAVARFLPAPAPIVRLFRPGDVPRVEPGEVILREEPLVLRPGEPLPGWSPRWALLRSTVPAPRALLCEVERLIGACEFER